jgi:hypothetical protein
VVAAGKRLMAKAGCRYFIKQDIRLRYAAKSLWSSEKIPDPAGAFGEVFSPVFLVK